MERHTGTLLSQHANSCKILQREDPFVHVAVENACHCLPRRIYSDLDLDFRFITEPLQKLLHEPLPIPHIL